MNGNWIQDPSKGNWHLVWERNHPHNEAIGEIGETVAWCGYRRPSENDGLKPGSQINGLFDSVHDECYRKSEEL